MNYSVISGLRVFQKDKDITLLAWYRHFNEKRRESICGEDVDGTTVKPVYKGNSQEHEKCALYEQLTFI